jgi:hypothetical protein
MMHARRLVRFALAALLAAPLVTAAAPAGAAPKRDAASSPTAKAAGYRQFTGTVVAVDAASITVEKAGKTPKQMVFARHAGMRSAGEVGKDTRVTVYWRDEAGRPVAHRVVVKTAIADGTR